MAFAILPQSLSATPPNNRQRYTDYPMALGVVTTVFFMWGLLTALNDILIPHLKSTFQLDYAQVMLVQSTFFEAYLLMALPSGKLVAALGYKNGMVAGLAIASVGALGFWPAAALHLYGASLAALFVLATGITVLQVTANPHVSLSAVAVRLHRVLRTARITHPRRRFPLKGHKVPCVPSSASAKR